MKKIDKGALLPDQDCVIRYVSPARLRRDEDGNILGFLPQAFALRDGEESLSVNWPGIYDGDHEASTKEVIWELRAANEIRRNSAFGIGSVGNIKEACKNNGAAVKIVYDPRKGIPSHSLIRNLPRDNPELLDALANDVFCDLVRNVDVEEAQAEKPNLE